MSGRNLGLGEEPAGAPDQLAVRVDLALVAQVADQIDVEPRAVLAAQLVEPVPERHMHRSADLLVEQDVAREPVDLVVEAEGDLAEDAGPVVHCEQRVEVGGPMAGLVLDDAAALESQPYVLDLAPLEDGREPEAHRALGHRLQWTRV